MSLHLLYGLCTYVCVGVCVERKKRVIDRKVLTGSWIINQTNRKRSVYTQVRSESRITQRNAHSQIHFHTHSQKQAELFDCLYSPYPEAS